MSTSSSTVILSNLVNQLPTGTFLTFQTLAPLFTNNGQCGKTELFLTGTLMLLYVVLCWTLCFTDSFTTSSGHIYYGIVTTKGLFNPQFKYFSNLDYTRGSFYVGPQGSKQYYITGYDFVSAFVTVVSFCALTLITAPLNQCFYGNVPSTISKAVPVLVALVAVLFFSFAPPARHGVGFGMTNSGPHLVQDPGDHDPPQASSSKLPTGAATRVIVPTNEGNGMKDDHAATVSRYTLRDYLAWKSDEAQ
ncbi:hypothetical protein O6H91_05G014300 [Diphasiastrum complanatum]|uniref:Uncharacterized protein n=1 Tax=Diphasiastrum complanatum TaxID=34168 RepID=A0ACC2DKY8_DIPCM|nr:hypothetical protein O6H91_Y497800 [Diphasiastrum complanatum]KAJ7554884.1 hypothetical protein O6H91_05G014300 [Diphasiastrum complanatum]